MAKDFFNRKEGKQNVISETADYDPKNFDNDLEACGITDQEGFAKRHEELFSNLIVDSDQENPVATLAKKLEESFSMRELAFLMSKDILQEAYQQTINNLNNN